jgi:hypothetical protein
MKALLELFKQVQQNEEFDAIKIGPRSPEKIRSWSLRRGEEARDHQLPDLQAGARRPVLRAHLRADQGLRVRCAASTSGSSTAA